MRQVGHIFRCLGPELGGNAVQGVPWPEVGAALQQDPTLRALQPPTLSAPFEVRRKEINMRFSATFLGLKDTKLSSFPLC